MYTVLYVDDEQHLLDLAKIFLERSPEFCVITQNSALAALDSPLLAVCDVIVSDYQMPEMDGIAFLKAVRERSKTLPFILFTGRGREEVVIEAINNGVDFYLQKGGDPKSQFAELAHKIRMAVERKRAVDEHFESDNRLSLLFHGSPIHQMITEFSSGRILDINDRFLNDLKISRNEVLGRTLEEIGLFIEQPNYSALMHQLEWEGVVRNAELLVRSRNGRTYTTLTSLTRVQVHGQDLIYTQSVDITAQKKAQQTINALLNAPPDVSLLLDNKGRILAANHAATLRFGLPVQDLIGRDAFTLLSPDLADMRRAKVDEAIATREPLVYLDDRTGRSYENHLYPVVGPDGEVSAVAIHSHDDTEERQAKKALKESEEKYRLVVEHSHDSIYIYRDDHFLFINRQVEEISGYSHDELMKHELWDFIHPDDRMRLKESAAKRFAGGHLSSAFEARILRKNGEVRDAEFFVDLVVLQGKPAILGIARDVTEKKRAEAALREREEQLRSLSDNLPSGMVYQGIIEPDGKRRFIYVSAGVEQIHEVTVEEVLQDPMVLYNQIAAEDRILLRDAENLAISTMSPLCFEARVRTPSGKIRSVLLRSAPRPHCGGGTIWDGIELDITATKQAEGELKVAYEELAASQEELKGQFDTLKTGEELLRESEDKYRTLVEHIDDGVFIAQDGKHIFVNEVYAAISGYSADDLIGKPFSVIVAPEDREMVLSRHKKRLEGNLLPETYEFSLLHRDGTTRVRVKIRVGTGTYAGRPATLGTLHDVTEERKCEAALAQSEELLRKMIAAVPDFIVRTDLDGTILFINENGVKLSGYTDPADLTGTSMFSFFAPESLSLARENTKRMFERPLGPVEYTFITSTGVKISLEVNGDVLRTPEGTPYGMVFIGRDITERRRAEAALAESEELHRSVFMASPDGIAMVDTKGILTYVSPKALEMFGLSVPEEAIGTHVLTWMTDNDCHLAEERLTEVQSDSRFVSHVYRVHRPDGSPFVVEMHSAALHNSDGSVRGIISVLRDITERRRAEVALRESEENYRLIIENMQDVFYRVNREGIITMISTYGARLVGFDSADEIIGKYRATDFYADPVERDEFIAFLTRERVVTGYPLTLRDRHGELHYATASSRLLYDPEGKVNGIEGILHDVTHLKRVEDALRQANRQITLMTSVTRHDIRNQLLVLGGWLELSRKSVGDPARMLELITKGQHIASIIEDQINFTTFFDEMGLKDPAWQDPVPLIRKSELSLPFKTIRLDVSISSLEIFADPLFEKVFYNLFDNALRYGGDPMTTIRVTAHNDGSVLVLAVEDDGMGISDPDKVRLFEHGYGKNTGLGLFLVKEILSITGMSIRETGIFGKGARFEIMVPAGKYRSGEAVQQIP